MLFHSSSTSSSRPRWAPAFLSIPEAAAALKAGGAHHRRDSFASAFPSTRWIAVLVVLGVSAAAWLFFGVPFHHLSVPTAPSTITYAPLTPADALLVRLGYKQKQLASGYQISGVNQSFADFLSVYPRDDLIWITLADIFYSQTCTPHLQHFVDNLEPYEVTEGEDQGVEKATSSRVVVAKRKHTLITLCIDPGCMETCRQRGWNCYGEYEATRPDIIFPATWPKLSGLIDILETGRDAIFVDSDVFFRSNPFDKLAPLGSFDWQIQDEAIEGSVNTGFFHIMPTPQTIAHWKGVVEMDMQRVSRDQHNTNILLGTSELRPRRNASSEEPEFIDEIVSKNGIHLKVIAPETVYAFHVGLSWPKVQWTDAVAWHGTCLQSREYKYLLPREHGYWQDVDQYYSRPPRLLVLPFLTGTREQIVQQFNFFTAVSLATNRSMVPPATINVILEDGQTVNRGLFSVLPMHELVVQQGLPLLEADYIGHAVPYHTSDPQTIDQLLQRNPLRVRAYKTVQDIIERLQREDFASKQVVTLEDWEATTLQPEAALKSLDNNNQMLTQLCYHLDQQPACDRMCYKENY